MLQEIKTCSHQSKPRSRRVERMHFLLRRPYLLVLFLSVLRYFFCWLRHRLGNGKRNAPLLWPHSSHECASRDRRRTGSSRRPTMEGRALFLRRVQRHRNGSDWPIVEIRKWLLGWRQQKEEEGGMRAFPLCLVQFIVKVDVIRTRAGWGEKRSSAEFLSASISTFEPSTESSRPRAERT
jgi:hypothetical protein